MAVKQYTVRIEEEVFNEIKNISIKKNAPLSDVFRDIINKGLREIQFPSFEDDLRKIHREETKKFLEYEMDDLYQILNDINKNILSSYYLSLLTSQQLDLDVNYLKEQSKILAYKQSKISSCIVKNDDNEDQ